jgi:hypothetical protein
LHGALALVVRIDLDERLGPVAAIGVLALHLVADVLGTDAREAAGEGAVFLDQPIAEGEDVFHRASSSPGTSESAGRAGLSKAIGV